LQSVAATVLREGPEKHGGQVYWLSAEVANGQEVLDGEMCAIDEQGVPRF
jgi:ATP-dependent DNA ligase